MERLAAAILAILVFASPIQAADGAGAMDFTFEQDDFRMLGMGLRQTIYADGVITVGTAERLSQFMAANDVGPGAMIGFNSPGGNLADSLRIGRLIRQRDMQTNVARRGVALAPGDPAAICYSACSLAFLGGAVRYVPPPAMFGVHRFSMSENNLTGEQAMDLSQMQSSEIAEYVNFLGVRPDFITEMNRSGPTDVSILSQQQLANFRVVTPQRESIWELRTTPEGYVYAAGEAKDIRGIHKILFACPPSRQGGPSMHLMFNTDPAWARNIVETTATTKLRINEQEFPILKGELLKGPFADKTYVSVTVALTPRIFSLIQGANTLGLSMIHRGGGTYAGFDADFIDGKQRVLSYLRPCLAGAR